MQGLLCCPSVNLICRLEQYQNFYIRQRENFHKREMNLIKKTCELKSCVDDAVIPRANSKKENLNRIDGFD